MKQVFTWWLLFIGVWLIISSWFLGYHSLVGRWYVILTGIVIVVLSLKFVIGFAPKTIWPYWVNGLLGIGLIISGAGVMVVGEGYSHANEIICGIFITLLSFLSTQIMEGIPVRLYTKDGAVLMETRGLEHRGRSLVIRGKIMGTMPTTAYLYPEEAWAMIGLLNWKIIFYLPFFLFFGWRERKKLRK